MAKLVILLHHHDTHTDSPCALTMITPHNPTAIIFDDHLLFAESFSVLIERLDVFHSIHLIRDKDELTRFLIKHHHTPVYLFLDYYLPGDHAPAILSEARRLNKRLRAIILSSVVAPSIITNIMTYQPDGFISKSSGTDVILQCMETIAAGKTYTCPIIRDILKGASITRTVPFTDREIEVLQYFANGLSIAQTAEATYLSKHTIVAHRRNMMAKANCKSITELLAYARKFDLI